MPVSLIQSNPDFKIERPSHEDYLFVAEFFTKTIQGEGVNTGCPATFLRLTGCTLDCHWCDSASVWRYGNPYTFDELFSLMEKENVIDRLKFREHLILTGGSPLKQQTRLVEFLHQFIHRYGFIPYIEVENETVLTPTPEFISFVSCWNNSPKLANSGMKERARYKPDVIRYTSELENSWFKFVVQGQECWDEIEKDFLKSRLIRPEQIILMPCGENQEELKKTREKAVELAIQNNVRFCDREHVVVWDRKTGV